LEVVAEAQAAVEEQVVVEAALEELEVAKEEAVAAGEWTPA